jgi:hypothetical protein
MRFTLFQSFALVNGGEACVLAGRRIVRRIENGSVEPYSLSLAIAESLGLIVEGVR